MQFTNTGSVTIGNGTTTDALTLSGTTVTGSGSITIENAALLYLSGSDTLAGGNLSNFGTVDAEGAADVFNDETVTNSGAIVVSGALTLENGSTITNEALTNTITIEGGASLALDDTSAISNGTTTVDSNGTLTLNGTSTLRDGTLDNLGKVDAEGSGNVLDDETATNSGNLTENSWGDADGDRHDGEQCRRQHQSERQHHVHRHRLHHRRQCQQFGQCQRQRHGDAVERQSDQFGQHHRQRQPDADQRDGDQRGELDRELLGDAHGDRHDGEQCRRQHQSKGQHHAPPAPT